MVGSPGTWIGGSQAPCGSPGTWFRGVLGAPCSRLARGSASGPMPLPGMVGMLALRPTPGRGGWAAPGNLRPRSGVVDAVVGDAPPPGAGRGRRPGSGATRPWRPGAGRPRRRRRPRPAHLSQWPFPGGRPAAATAGPVGLGRPGGAGGGLGWPGRPGARSGRPGRRATPVGSGELVFGSMVATYQLDTRRQAPARACAQLFRANSIGQSRPRAEGAGPRAATHRARYCLGFRPPPKTLCQVCAHGSDPPREPNFQTNCRGPERPTVPGKWWPASEVIWKSTSIPASELVVRNEAPRRQPPPRAIPGERGACGPPVRRPQSAELHHLNRYAWA
jgi:hypothetical protein